MRFSNTIGKVTGLRMKEAPSGVCPWPTSRNQRLTHTPFAIVGACPRPGAEVLRRQDFKATETSSRTNFPVMSLKQHLLANAVFGDQTLCSLREFQTSLKAPVCSVLDLKNRG